MRVEALRSFASRGPEVSRAPARTGPTKSAFCVHPFGVHLTPCWKGSRAPVRARDTGERCLRRAVREANSAVYPAWCLPFAEASGLARVRACCAQNVGLFWPMRVGLIGHFPFTPQAFTSGAAFAPLGFGQTARKKHSRRSGPRARVLVTKYRFYSRAHAGAYCATKGRFYSRGRARAYWPSNCPRRPPLRARA